jgi:anaerobic ribonucleoside-triphosphate reductase activating protein
MQSFKDVYPDKNIWAYTGYTLDDLMKHMSEGSIPGYREHLQKAFELIDVLVDGPFIESLKDEQYPWAGSTNQRVINLKETLKTNPIDGYTSLIPILFSYGN